MAPPIQEGNATGFYSMNVNQTNQVFLRRLLCLLDEAAVEPELFTSELERRGIARLFAVEGEDSLVLLEAAVDLSGDPSLMIRLGQELDIKSYGSFGFALMSCANVRESIQLLLRYGHIIFRPSWEVHELKGGLILRAQITKGTARQQQFLAELLCSNLNAIGRALYGSKVERSEGTKIFFTHQQPLYSASYHQAFKTPITFGAEHNQVFLPSDVLDIPVRTADRAKHIVFQQLCEEMLRGLNAVEKTTVAVRYLLIQSAGDFLDIAQVASRLHMSERTLRRRLEHESTSFRVIIDEVKDLLAREYLTKTQLTVADIAHLLDYAETVSFRRAFVRWNGVTPREYRQHKNSVIAPYTSRM